MNRNGFSLTELIVVMGIIGILLTIGSLSYSDMMRKYAIDNQTRAFYADLMDLRVRALYKKKSHYVVLSSSSYASYSSADGSGTPIGRIGLTTLKYPVVYPDVWNNIILFNSQGLTTDLGSICVEPSGNSGNVDSLVISMTRINFGKRVSGGVCNSENINIE